MREGPRAFAAGVDVRLPTGDEQNLLGTAPWRPAIRGVLGVLPRVRAARQHRLSMERTERAGWRCPRRLEADLPDQFLYAVGTDFSVNIRFSIVFDVLGSASWTRRVFRPTRSATGAAGSADLPDIRFANGSTGSRRRAWIQGQRRVACADEFQLRFTLGQNGLTDRIAPLIGVEWAF